MSMLGKLRITAIGQKYRFDLGVQFLAILNFALLVITASDKLKGLFGVNLSTSQVLVIAIPLAFVAMWVFGFFLDKVVGYPQHLENEVIKRSPAWTMARQKFESIEKKLDKIEKKLS